MSETMSIAILKICLFFFISSCSSQTSPIAISKAPVFSESDTFKTSLGNTVKSKHDYYLINGDITRKNILRAYLDSASEVILKEHSAGYRSYSIFYYQMDASLNPKSIELTEAQYRYKIFTKYNYDNFVACYNYRDSIFSSIDWGQKFKK